MKVISVLDFGALPGGPDVTLAVWRAIQACHQEKNATLLFPKGDYHFYPDLAQERQLAISNNSHGLKRMGLPLFDLNGLKVEGNGSRFLMHGKIIPIVISGGRNISICDLSIDWVDPFIGQGKIVATGETYFDLELSHSGSAWKLKDNTLYFVGEGWEDRFDYFLEFDGVTAYVAGKVLDNAGSGWHRYYQVEALSEANKALIRVHAPFKTPPKVGNLLLLKGGSRHTPGLFLETTENCHLEKISIYHAGGMAFIGQKCSGVTLKTCRVEATPGTGRIFSSKADATHFVGCRGQILLEACHFEGQLDDPGNFHGIYGRVDSLLGDRQLLVRLVHHEQVGFPLFSKGERVSFIDPETLLPAGEGCVTEIEILNVDRMLVSVDQMPGSLKPGFGLENLEWLADVTIRNCTSLRNRARGFLLSTGGKLVVEGNYFSNPGAALKISGDCNFWFESGAVKDVLIKNNTFEQCNHGVWGKACIDIDPEVQNLGHGFFHQNITIENNTFITSEPNLVYARSLSGLNFKKNKAQGLSAQGISFRLELESCLGVTCVDNQISGELWTDGKITGTLT